MSERFIGETEHEYVCRLLDKHGTLWGQIIYGPTDRHYLEVRHFPTREESVQKAVSMAIQFGWRPPRWYEFWRPKWSKACVAEYERQAEEVCR